MSCDTTNSVRCVVVSNGNGRFLRLFFGKQAYFSGASDLYKEQIKGLLMGYINLVRKASDEEGDTSFAPQTATVSRGATIRRAGTMGRSPLEGRNRDKATEKDGELRGYEVQ
jgi:exocyst complex component 1